MTPESNADQHVVDMAAAPRRARRITLRVLRAVPLVMLVAWAVAGYGLPGPNIPGFPGFEENTADA